MFRERLASLINKDLGMTVCGEADCIRDAMHLARTLQPEIAIVDITLRGSSGLELLKDFRAQGCQIPVLVLSMHDEALYAERVLRAGARGYIMKSEASSEVVKAIRRVNEGGVYLSDRMTSSMLERFSARSRGAKLAGMEALTDRELEVFQLIGRGKNSREIAKELVLGESTVETYRARIREKLNLRNAAELYRHAAQWLADKNSGN